MDSTVMQTLTRSTSCKLINEADLKKENPSSFTAIISGAAKVYNLFEGTVKFLGCYKGMSTVSVEVSPYELIKYCNLTKVEAWFNTELDVGQYIGTVPSNTMLQLEYCTLHPDSTRFPVRINDMTYYKNNMLKILDGNWEPEQRYEYYQGVNSPKSTVVFRESQKYEWGIFEKQEIDPNVYQIGPNEPIPKSAAEMLSHNGRSYL